MSTGQSFNIPQQIQQVNSLIDQKPDLADRRTAGRCVRARRLTGRASWAFPRCPSRASRAASTRSTWLPTSTRSIAQSASRTVRQMGGKGNTMFMHGLGVDHGRSGCLRRLQGCPEELSGRQSRSARSAGRSCLRRRRPRHSSSSRRTPRRSTGRSRPAECQRAFSPPSNRRGARCRSSMTAPASRDRSPTGSTTRTSYTGVAAASATRSLRVRRSPASPRASSQGRGVKVSTITQPYVHDRSGREPRRVGGSEAGSYDDADSAEGPPQVFFPEKFLDTLFTNPSK